MNVKMYGRLEGCVYCTRAKNICSINNFNLEFIDIDEAGLGITELHEICGVPVRSIPQIFVDEKYIGGCEKFIEFLKGE